MMMSFWKKSIPVFALMLGATACLLLLGCSANSRTDDSFFNKLLPPSPGEVAREAFLDYDADKRRRSVNLLSAAPWGGEDPYLKLYRFLIDDQDATVRAACVKALGMHGQVQDTKLIVRRLGDSFPFVRWEAAKSLQKIHSPEAIRPLVKALLHDEDSDVRMASANALGQYAQSRVFIALVGALDDRSHGVVHESQQALKLLTGESHGDDGGAWMAWSENAGANMFDNQQQYTWAPYVKPRNFFDKARFWKKPKAVENRVPIGAEEDAPPEPSSDAKPQA